MSGSGPTSALAELLFKTISEGHLRTAACVGLARVTLSQTHNDPWVYLHAVVLGVVAAYNAELLADLDKPVPHPPSGWQDYAPFLAASAFSYIVGLRLFDKAWHDVLVGLFVAPAVWFAVCKGFVWTVLRCACASWVGVGLTLLSSDWMAPDKHALRWGVAGAASSMVYVWLPACATYILPVREMLAGYETVEKFVDPHQLRSATQRVMIASAHIQMSLGFLGLWYLRQSQLRKNGLLSIKAAPAPSHTTADTPTSPSSTASSPLRSQDFRPSSSSPVSARTKSPRTRVPPANGERHQETKNAGLKLPQTGAPFVATDFVRMALRLV
jgi:hypothetical protein